MGSSDQFVGNEWPITDGSTRAVDGHVVSVLQSQQQVNQYSLPHDDQCGRVKKGDEQEDQWPLHFVKGDAERTGRE